MTTTYSSRSRAIVVPVQCSSQNYPYTYVIRSPFSMVHDAPSNPEWEAFSDKDVPNYIARGSTIFTRRFAQFVQPESTYDEETASDLHMMLDALIVAKSLTNPSNPIRTIYSQ